MEAFKQKQNLNGMLPLFNLSTAIDWLVIASLAAWILAEMFGLISAPSIGIYPALAGLFFIIKFLQSFSSLETKVGMMGEDLKTFKSDMKAELQAIKKELRSHDRLLTGIEAKLGLTAP